MEKKGVRAIQPLSKGLTSDTKKSQDVTKQWPRGGKQREPAAGSLSTKNDVSRKPTPQRAKNFDKRPRSRGNYSPPIVARSSASGLDEQDVELGSVFHPGSKKQSLNHLLNFVYSSRDDSRSKVDRGCGRKDGRFMNTKKHAYNKEHFLQANCEFIVNNSGDYKQYLNNTDALVDWNCIEQINVQVHEIPSCPICLYPPMAAKMTRCGHIYCWSCLLHYLSLSDKTSRKCPICFDAIEKLDLKSVITVAHQTFNCNDTITFNLMKRQKGSLIVCKADVDLIGSQTFFNVSESLSKDVHSKLLLANKRDILNIIHRERVELEIQMSLEENSPESCFVEEALALLQERELSVLENMVDEVQINVRKTVRERNLGETDFDEITEAAESSDNTSSENSEILKHYYFYQAADGQHIYLHAVNARMLEHTYGSLEFAPKTITGRILEKEGGSMTEDLRKRLRYLQHMPVTCQFEVAEIELRMPTVTKETMEFFHDQLEIRKKRRSKRARDEKRRERQIAEEENKRMGKIAAANIHLESQVQFPEFSAQFRARTESEATSASAEISLDSGSSPPPNCSYQGPSFATMLTSSSKKSSSSRPTPSAIEPTSVKLINATGSKLKSLKTISGHRKGPDSDVEEGEDYIPVPQLNRSFGDVIAQALQEAAQREASEDNETVSTGRKKKKKNKQKILFATSMAYAGN